MKYKKCRKCKEQKTIDNFFSSGHKTKDGKAIIDTLCKPCKKEYNRNKRRSTRAWIWKLKNAMACSKCGYSKATHPNFAASALQFHHPQDNKSFAIGDAGHRGYSKEKIIKEINKCVCLCCRCHAEIHYTR